MRGNRSRDTAPEIAIRSALHRLGLRFRKDFLIRAGGPRGIRTDIAFTRLRLAIFVDGCFWHGCPIHGRVPRANHDYWRAKLGRNSERDARNNETLEAVGWSVLRFWEHDPVDEAVATIVRGVRRGEGRCLTGSGR